MPIGREFELQFPARHESPRRGRMTWETPTFTEIKMDAEVSSYQGDDFGDV